MKARRRERLREWARSVKTDIRALGLAMGDPRVPWYAKLLAAGVVAYALSPIDLIPDVIPVIGYLDDLLLLPLGIVLVVRMIPPELMADLRERAATSGPPRLGWWAAGAVVVAWLLLATLVARWVFDFIR